MLVREKKDKLITEFYIDLTPKGRKKSNCNYRTLRRRNG